MALLRKAMEFERAFVKAGGLLIAGSDPTGNAGIVAGFGDLRQVLGSALTTNEEESTDSPYFGRYSRILKNARQIALELVNTSTR